MKNPMFSFKASSAVSFVLMNLSVFLVWLMVCPSGVHASPIIYRIDYTLLSSSTMNGPVLPGAPLPTIFAYDPSTDVFNGLTMVWPSSTWNTSFGFSNSCGFGPWCGSNFDVNALSNAFRQSYFSDLLNGGTWFAATTPFGIDAQVGLDGLSFNALSIGNNMGDSAAGTFTTTQVPEPSSLILIGAGLAVIIAAKFRKRRALPSH